MGRDPRAFLWDVRAAADKIATFVQGKSADEFVRDELTSSAVERQLEIIGEALGQLAKADPAIAARIPDLSQIVALRNILIHGYVIVKRDLVWRTIHEDLPRLREVVDGLLTTSGPPQQ